LLCDSVLILAGSESKGEAEIETDKSAGSTYFFSFLLFQKFHFVGGLDCPEWIVAEMTFLSKLPVLKFKNWCLSCVDCLINGRTEWNDEHLTVLNVDKTLDDESLKGMLAALTFILEKTTKNACSARDLELEMQQLGLPAEHCRQLAKVYTTNLEKLKSALLFSFSRASSLTISSVDATERGNGKVYIMNMRSNGQENTSIVLDDAKLNYLVQGDLQTFFLEIIVDSLITENYFLDFST
uniref:COMM domain-containing protein n=1 Tax=Brugia timori TaxID=42155 RepID=A0A0R3QTA9_9BILA